MKKFFSVAVSVMLCICMMAPAAFAVEETTATDDILGVIEGVASGETSDVLGELGLGDLDLGGLLGSFIESEVADDETDPQVKVEQALQDAQASAEAEMGIDLDWLTTLLSDSIDVEAIKNFFTGFSAEDMPDLLTIIAEAFAIWGIDLANFDASALGEFDIDTLVGGSDTVKPQGIATEVASDDSSMITTDVVTGIVDGLRGGVEMIGLDADGLLASMGENEIVNFFANMYIGFIGEVEEEVEDVPETLPEETTTAPAPEKTPDTGDNAAVVVALATLCVATAAAGVCLKKKED